MRLRTVESMLIVMLFSPMAGAVDGVLEINQACIAAGCVPGDPAGFPVELNVGGSYILTSNVTVPDIDTNAIEIDADEVTLDLNGFSILGPNTCSGTPVTSCTGGLGHGVFVVNDGTRPRNARVLNGEIRGVGQGGLSMLFSDGTRVENVRVFHSGATGVQVGSRAQVFRVTSDANGLAGIGLSTEGRVVDSRAMHNAGDGITTFGDTVITGSSAIENGGNGISCSHPSAEGCVIENSLSHGHASSIGISVGEYSVVRSCRSTENGNGIMAGEGSLVESSTLGANTTGQLTFLSDGGYVGNVLTGGSLVSGGTQLGSNLCNGSLCP